MLRVIEIAFCCYAVTDMAMIFDPDGNTICIHKRNKSQIGNLKS